MDESTVSLQQIQRRQKESCLIWHSEQQLAGMAGQDNRGPRLAEAGIGHGRRQRAQAIIERLKQQRGAASEQHGKT